MNIRLKHNTEYHMLKQNIILKSYYALKHIVNDGTMWTLILTSVFIITHFIFLFLQKWACSHAREEDGSAICSHLVRPQRTPFLMAQTQLSYIVIKKFLQSGSDRFPRRDSELGLYKLHKF